jgi:uncharacterized membrane protein YdbT with pleckstrin-like domain
MAGYTKSLLADGEHVVFRTRQHPVVLVRAVGHLLLFILVSIVLLALQSGARQALGTNGAGALAASALVLAAALVALAGILRFARRYLRWRLEDYVVTNWRVIKIDGIVRKRAADSSLNQINDAVLRQSALGRLLDYGDLDVMTAAKEDVDTFSRLHHAPHFKVTMVEAKHDLEMGQSDAPDGESRVGSDYARPR